MAFQILQRFLQATGLNLALSAAVFAQDCSLLPSVLIHSCQTDVQVYLRVLPDEAQTDSQHMLTVAGTYSSGDRFGIEGLVIKDGKIISRRYQNWDGVLIIDKKGVPNLYHARDVALDGENYNLKEKSLRDGFVAKAKELGVSVLQSHLLINDGRLDLKDVANAPKFKRRMLVIMNDGSFGIWESAQAKTLYDAAHQVQQELNPKMALNLDMGAYDYCVSGPAGAQKDCGRLIVSEDKLTNLLEFTKG
ncbi:MAG: succinate dehydrogenase [Amylibacter sp.]